MEGFRGTSTYETTAGLDFKTYNSSFKTPQSSELVDIFVFYGVLAKTFCKVLSQSKGCLDYFIDPLELIA